MGVGKETGGKKMEDPHSLKSNEMAQVTFQPQQPLVVDSFKNCEGLSRIAFLDGNTAVMLGKVVSVVKKSDMPPEEKKRKGAPHGVALCGAAADGPSPIEVPGQLQFTRAGLSCSVARPFPLWLACGTTYCQTVSFHPWREPYSIAGG